MGPLARLAGALALATTSAEKLVDAAEGGEKERDWREALEKLHKLVDADNDGRLHLNELMHFGNTTRRELAMPEPEAAQHHFAVIDKNGDERVSLAEFLANADESDQDFLSKQAFHRVDADGDGMLVLKEFMHLHTLETDEEYRIEQSAEFREAFQDMDTDGNGRVSEAELADAEGDDQAQAHFHQLDADGDGSLTLHELAALDSGRAMEEQVLRALLERADSDADEHLDLHEMLAALESPEGDPDSEIHFLLGDWAEHHEL